MTPKARVRAALLAACGTSVHVTRDDLAEVLRELGELRQVVEQQGKGLRDAASAALAANRSMGRVFANAAAAEYERRCARLEQALITVRDMNAEHDSRANIAATIDGVLAHG
jgi:hypothetical protein